ncbi:MAG TPA: 3-keto-5-aminohexanoate cleavage protein, partial [Rhodobacteraceae bacterium]|nr:3-keto-5-aminohexanoate cleavage protein [Paracoccaceae bacterium]
AAHDKAVHGFLLWLKKTGIWPQFIVYDAGDLQRLRDLHGRGLIPFERPWLLFVLGRYSGGRSKPADLEPFLAALAPLDWPWAVCAFGPREAACMERAAGMGGHMRVGFENNLYLPDGAVAPDNAALVRLAAATAREAGRALLGASELRALTMNG